MRSGMTALTTLPRSRWLFSSRTPPRSVVERRQQIAMLRAVGFQSQTVALTFVLESGFVALMGILSGVVGGVIVSHNLFTTGQFSDANITFTMPWLEVIGFVVASFVVSRRQVNTTSTRTSGRVPRPLARGPVTTG